ncbi:hypothetical protein [uncultured Kordia sp.]|uniref:hypothetical protein n=1 Tax=uncultured Kordia sp. TaxID=507699 RepID=UPI00262A054E|nr:hypothetical protein [uncultured Kordia sp.]
MRTKGHIFFNALGSIVKAMWKLFLLAVFIVSKLIEAVSGFFSKLTEKMLN